MATEQIYVGIDNDRVELTGDDLTAYKAQKTKDRAEEKKLQTEADAKLSARESALAKLAALGLTAEEVASL
jgi:DNA-binding NarL/FixJ family response regulator